MVLRAQWPDPGVTAGEFLEWYAERGPVLSERALDLLEEAKSADPPLEDKWGTAGRSSKGLF